MTPIAASVPNARRRRSAVRAVSSLARASLTRATWRAVMPTNIIAATTTVFSSSTRPYLLVNSSPPTSR